MSILVALGTSCVAAGAAGAAGAAIVSAIRARQRTADRDRADRDRFLLTACWTGVDLMASFVAWDQWDRVIA